MHDNRKNSTVRDDAANIAVIYVISTGTTAETALHGAKVKPIVHISGTFVQDDIMQRNCIVVRFSEGVLGLTLCAMVLIMQPGADTSTLTALTSLAYSNGLSSPSSITRHHTTPATWRSQHSRYVLHTKSYSSSLPAYMNARKLCGCAPAKALPGDAVATPALAPCTRPVRFTRELCFVHIYNSSTCRQQRLHALQAFSAQCQPVHAVMLAATRCHTLNFHSGVFLPVV